MSVKRLLKNEIKVTGPSRPTNIVKQRISLLAAVSEGVTLKDNPTVPKADTVSKMISSKENLSPSTSKIEKVISMQKAIDTVVKT